MKIVELREKNTDELLKTVDELRTKIHQTQLDVVMNKSHATADIATAKKDLARVMTVLSEKELNA